MNDPQVSLDQWRALISVVDAGGYAQAAEALGKSQSAVSYAVQKLETALGIRAFKLKGRRAALTAAGELLYRRAKVLLADAEALENAAARLTARHETEIHIAMEAIFPVWLMLDCLGDVAERFPHTRVEVYETVLTGTDEALLERRVDLAIAGRVPVGFLGTPLMRTRFIPVASPDHPLHHLPPPLSYQDLRQFRQIVIRDSGSRRSDTGWLGAEQRWTVSNFPTSIRAACQGHGFAWYPEEKIRDELASGTLKPLELAEGGERYADIYLIYTDHDFAGPATRYLGERLKERTRQCP